MPGVIVTRGAPVREHRGVRPGTSRGNRLEAPAIAPKTLGPLGVAVACEGTRTTRWRESASYRRPHKIDTHHSPLRAILDPLASVRRSGGLAMRCPPAMPKSNGQRFCPFCGVA